ncbi:MAG: choice-of-anchor L domain-containing protein [Bacteroidales bacterium]|nr:choice-of-anchor L domain-containing protein [Bacteroidales bacterium]
MKVRIRSLSLWLAMTILMPISLNAQFGDFTIIPCTDNASVIALIDTVFLNGVSPAQYKNVTFTGDPTAVGYFYDGFMFGGFHTKKGIVMSTGYVDDLDNINNCSGGVVTGNTSGGSDVDLAKITAPTAIFDACVIEFDFKPTNQTSSFRYIFGSEEYPDYVNSSYNDVFGFFLSGDNINGTFSHGAINIALVPGTNLPVSINNVNCGHAQDCQAGPGGTYCDLLYENIVQNSPAFNNIALDAYTVSFTAENATTPCTWYHIKLAIGDAGDAKYDSGVFLEMGSFDPGKIIETTNFAHPTIDSLLYESCRNYVAVMYFDIGTARSDDITIPFMVGGTATQGLDYIIQSTQPGQIYIPAGQTYDSLVIRPFPDNEVEGIESVIIKYTPQICPGIGFEEKDSILISDVPRFVDTNLVFSSICENTIALGFDQVLTGIPPFNYNWRPDGQSTSILSYTITGSDSVAVPCVITDTCGYQVVDTAFVKVPALVADAGPDKSLCNLPNVQLEGSSDGAQHFLWTASPPDITLTTPAIPDPIVSPTVNTTYTLNVTDNCTNSDADEAMVLLNEAVADAGNDQSMCLQQSVTLECNQGTTYNWTSDINDPSLVGQQGNKVITVSPIVTTTYSVDVTNACGLTATDEVVVVVNPLPTASAGNDNQICLNESYSLQGSGGIHYLWTSVPDDPSLHGNQQDTLANPAVTPDTQTDYIYTVSVTNEFGCESEASMILAVNPIPNMSVTTTNTTICLGDSTTLTAVGNADYTWSADINDPGLTGQIHNQVIKVSPSVTTTYTLTGVVSGFNCPATIEQTIVVIPETTANFSANVSQICQNQPLTISYEGNGTGSGMYQWDFDQGNITPGNGQGPYLVEWTDAGSKTLTLTVTEQGCPSKEYIQKIEVLKMPQAEFSALVQEGCPPLTIEFTDETQNTGTTLDYNWTFETGQTSTEINPSYTYTLPGTYPVSLLVTSYGLCTNQKDKTAYITVHEVPTADFIPDPEETILEEGTISFTNASTDIGTMTYSWNFGDGSPLSTETNPSHTYTASAQYTVELITHNNNLCSDTTTKLVTIHPDFAVYAPSAFTPNGDGKNDVFEIKGNGIKTLQIQIYSRWGELIFESNDMLNQWDGTIKGNPAPAGTYVYQISYTSMINLSYSIKGTVTLVR